jgi:hypothetical protein
LKLADAFQSHLMPAEALPVRCHVVKEEHLQFVENYLVERLPRCYTTIEYLKQRTTKTGMTASSLLANFLPDNGSVMSGDFGEILALFFLSSEQLDKTKLIKKWRYKQDRKKAAPHSDVILIYRKNESTPTKEDFVICAEAKQKATKSKTYIPIKDAVEGFLNDRTGRLARTMVWLKEKAIHKGQPKMISYLDRFTNDLSVEYSKYFKAIAIIDRNLLDEEISRKLDLPKQDKSFEIVVLGISQLKQLYETVFTRAIKEVTVE